MKTVVIDKTWRIDAKVFNDIYAVQYAVGHTDLYADYRVSKVITNFDKQVAHIEIIPVDYNQIKDVGTGECCRYIEQVGVANELMLQFAETVGPAPVLVLIDIDGSYGNRRQKDFRSLKLCVRPASADSQNRLKGKCTGTVGCWLIRRYSAATGRDDGRNRSQSSVRNSWRDAGFVLKYPPRTVVVVDEDAPFTPLDFTQ